MRHIQLFSVLAPLSLLLFCFNNCSSSFSTLSENSIIPSTQSSNSSNNGSSTGSQTYPTKTAQFTATQMTIPNPERGWAFWSGGDLVSAYDAGSVSAAYSQGHRLLSCLVSLAAYRTTSIPQSFIDNLNQAFGKVRAAGMKCSLLMRYDDSAAGNDAPASQIASHMAQLKSVLQANADVIAIAKAGMIGAWGEWHSSQNGNSCCYNTPPDVTVAEANANRVIVRDAILSAFHPQTLVEFRYPTDVMLWYPNVIGLNDAFTMTSQARTGSHNDCFQGGSDDTGTYTSGSAGTLQRDYVASQSEFAPYGGEQASNCSTPHRIACSDIMTEGATYHLSWLKDISGDTTEWTDSWKAGGCYDTVLNQMGYRISFQSISVPEATDRGTDLNIELSLMNSGWARVFSLRHVQVILISVADGTSLMQESALSLQSLPSQAKTATNWSFKMAIPPNASVGTYEVVLKMPDSWITTSSRREFMIRPANADTSTQAWDDTKGIFRTGLSVQIH
jgi:hypothetical protein